MRVLLPACSLALLLLAPAVLPAQQGRTTLAAGYGGIDHEASLGPAYHLNLRRQIARWDSIALSPPGPRRSELPGFEIQAEAFAQLGRSGTRVASCSPPSEQLCARGADPLYLLGAGLVSRIDLTRAERAVQLYFLPLTAAVYLRGYELHESPLGSTSGVAREELVPGGGIGNGVGLHLRAGGVQALLEVRAILICDARGGRGGALPISIGLVW